jgi:hypothetical protein
MENGLSRLNEQQLPAALCRQPAQRRRFTEAARSGCDASRPLRFRLRGIRPETGCTGQYQLLTHLTSLGLPVRQPHPFRPLAEVITALPSCRLRRCLPAK